MHTHTHTRARAHTHTQSERVRATKEERERWKEGVDAQLVYLYAINRTAGKDWSI